MADNESDINYPGGPPMVRIDGASARRIREQNGLTQLYVATVVQVTTDTISRWENRRYPSIRKENAEKLAEALGVELAVLLEQPEPPAAPLAVADQQTPTPATPVPAAPPPGASSRRLSRFWLAGLVLLALALLPLSRFFLADRQEPLPQITATRILPAHVPPGQDFPVLLKVSSKPAAAFALIIRENPPAGCRLTGASPTVTGSPGQEGQIKWVSRLEEREKLFAYRLTSPTAGPVGAALRFQGQVVAGSKGDTTAAVTGAERMTISPYHWADLDSDHRIDDEEILWVYEVFGTVEGFDDLHDEVDSIWTAGGYRWDEKQHKYLVGQ